MRSLIRARGKPKADPAPSRWAWRMQRLMLTPGFRLALRAGIPFSVALLAGTIYLSDQTRQARILQFVADARTSIQERPEFMVKLMAVDGAEGALAAEVRAAVPLEFPLSSFDLDLPAIRKDVAALNGVRRASVRVRPGGVLQIDVVPRVAVAIWRNEDGLALIDEGGALVKHIGRRGERPDLPLIAGEGAARQVPSALALLRSTPALGDRFRGLVWVGNRRWDVVLDRDQRIMLPTEGAQQALERIIALDRAQDVLARDVAVVDMRLARRPTVRMTEHATAEWWQIRQATDR